MSQTSFKKCALFLVLFSALSALSLEARSVKIQTEVAGSENGNKAILPTPIRVLSTADFQVLIRPGFGRPNQYQKFVPLASILEDAPQTQEFFQTFLDVDPRETPEARNERLQQVILERSKHLVIAKDELLIDLPQGRSAFLELGESQSVFGSDGHFLRKIDIPNSQREVKVVIPSVAFSKVERVQKIRYRFFKFQQSIILNAESVRTSYYEKPIDYLARVVVRQEENKFVRGVKEVVNTPLRAYIHSTCVEFSDRGELVTKPEWNEETQCWTYDLKQQGDLLPLTAENHSRMGTYFVMAESVDLEGTEQAARWTLVDLFKVAHMALPAVDTWNLLN